MQPPEERIISDRYRVQRPFNLIKIMAKKKAKVTKAKIVTASVFCVTTDGGDGSHGASFYKSREHWINSLKKEYKEDYDKELTEKGIEMDPYRYGYEAGQHEIKFRVRKDGSLELAERFSCSGG